MLSSCPAVHALLSDLVMLLFSALDLRDCCCFLVQQPFGICVLGMPPSHRCSFIIAQSQLYSFCYGTIYMAIKSKKTKRVMHKRVETPGGQCQELQAYFLCIWVALFYIHLYLSIFTSISFYLFIFVHFLLPLSPSLAALLCFHLTTMPQRLHVCMHVYECVSMLCTAALLQFFAPHRLPRCVCVPSTMLFFSASSAVWHRRFFSPCALSPSVVSILAFSQCTLSSFGMNSLHNVVCVYVCACVCGCVCACISLTGSLHVSVFVPGPMKV